MSTTNYALLIASLLSFGGLCWLAVALWFERANSKSLRAQLDQADETIATKSDAITNLRNHRDHLKGLVRDILKELSITRKERDGQKHLGVILATRLADTHAMPTIHGHSDESPEARKESSPVYDRLVRDVMRPRLGVVVSPFDGPKRVPGVDR